MNRARIQPSSLHGTAAPPPSKSAAHRAIICAGLAKGSSVLSPIGTSVDMAATIGCMEALGAAAAQTEDTLQIQGISALPAAPVTLDCAESGSTLRFLIPLAAALGVTAEFVGRGRLPQRPLGIYLDLLPQHGVACKTAGGLPLTVSGQLQPGDFCLPGDISSQFITGLLFALPLLSGDSTITLTTPLQSAAYVDMTCSALQKFGVQVTRTETGWLVPGKQTYKAGNQQIERDWSQAAFLLTAGALDGEVSLFGLDQNSAQGDRAIEDLLRCFGADLSWQDGVLTARPGELHGIDIDVEQIPDLAPILAVVGAFAQGHTRLLNGARLRLKESDRLTALRRMVCALGGQAEEKADSLIIYGTSLSGGTADGCNDHRIVMAAAIAALRAKHPVVVTDAEAVRKSWPEFFDVYKDLGGKADVILG